MSERCATAAVLEHPAEAPCGPAIATGTQLQESWPPESFEVASVPLYGAAGIEDDDTVRARQTARLIREIAPALGLDRRKLRIVVNESSAAAAKTRRAAALELNGVIQLDPDYYDPVTFEGRYLLGHELAHAAQRQAAGPVSATELVEYEAEEIGAAIARRTPFERPVLGLAGAEPLRSDTDVQGALDGTVKETRKREIQRIKKALKHIFWVSTSDITKALLTLQEMDFFTARAVIHVLENNERYDLVNNINSHHYQRFRPEIFACYAALSPEEVHRFDEGLLIKMDLHELTPEEHFAASYVLQYLKPAALARLQKSDNGPAIKAIVGNKPELIGQEKRLESKALEKEQERQRTEGEDKTVIDSDRELQADIQEIKDRMSDFFISDSKALAALDRAAKYVREPGKMRALANALEDSGALDTLVNQLPVKALFEEIHKEQDKDSKPQPSVPRRKAFLMLLSYRPPYKNVEKAEELTSLGLFDWAVTDEDAYLAFQLIKSVPQKSRTSFMQEDEGDRWNKTIGEMSESMRQAESANFYGGGKGQMDKAAIEAPLADGSLWVSTRLSELDGRVRMALAAGDHEFVFEESRRKDAYKSAGLKPLVDKYRLYDPGALDQDGKSAPRTEYSPELLKGTSFLGEGPIGGLVWAGRGIGLLSELDVTYGKTSGQRLSVAQIQKFQGGNIAGARFKSDEDVIEQQKKTGEDLGGGNFIDKVDIDAAKGVITVEAKVLTLASIRYFYGDTLIQSGEGKLAGIAVRAGYPSGDNKEHFLHLTVKSIVLHDILVTTTDSMTAVNQADIQQAQLNSASGAVDYEHQGEGNKENWFEKILTNSSTTLLGLVQLASHAGDIKKAFKQTAEFSISADSIVLNGVTMSNGEHIDKIELGHASFRTGEQIDGYQRALEASLATFPDRIKAEETAVANATAEPDKTAHEKQLARLTEQKAKVENELQQIKTDQSRIADLEAKKKNGKLDSGGERELANLKRGGTALDIETIKMTGISGPAATGDLTLSNVHGQGRLSQFVEGSDSRPFLKSQESASNLSLDVGDLKTTNLVLKKSPPAAEAVAKQIENLRAKLGENKPDFRTAEKLAKLEALLKDVTRYEELAKLGAANLDDSQRDEFAALRNKLYEEGSRTVGEVNIEGATIDLDFTGGLGSLADLRKTLKSASLSGKSVNLKDVTIPGTGFHADQVSATSPKLTLTPGEDKTTVGFSAAEILATGLRLQRTREDLEQQARQLDAAVTLTPKQQQRLAKIKAALADLDSLTAKAQEDEQALKAAKGTLGEAKAQQKLDADKGALGKWQDELVAQGVSVTNLNVSASVAGNLLSDDFDSDNLSGDITASFSKAEITGVEGGGAAVQKTTLSDAKGTVKYQADKIEISDFHLGSLALEGVNYSGNLKQIYTSQKATLSEITASATIAFQKSVGGDALATVAHIDSLRVESIAAENFRYEDSTGKQKATLDIASGTLNGVTLDNFDITIPDDPDGEIAYTGKLNVENIEKTKVLYQVAGGLKASGTLDGKNLNVEFAKEGDQIINIGGLDVSEGEAEKGTTRGKFNLSNLRGTVTRKKDGTTEFSTPMDEIEVLQFSWQSKDKRVFSNKPTVFSNITVDGSMHQNQASAEKEVDLISIARLHIDTVTGEDLTYTDGDTTFHIIKSDPAQKDPATALSITGIDLQGLTWRPKQKLTIDNLDVGHLAATFSAEVKSASLTADGKINADTLNVKLLKGGKLVTTVKDLNADVHGKAGAAEFNASLTNAKMTVTKDGDTVTVDPLTIKSLAVNSFSWKTPKFELDLPAGAGDLTLHDIEATVRVNLNPKPEPGSVPPGTPDPPLVKSIVIDKLVVPTTTGTGFTITLPPLGNLQLKVDKGNDLKLGKIELQGPTKGSGPFTIDHSAGSWDVLGKAVLTDGDIQKLGFDVSKSLSGSAKVHAEGGTLEFTAAGTKIDVNVVKIAELEAVAGSGTFRLIRGGTGTAFPDAGADLKGIHVSEKGDVTVDEAGVSGLTYDDAASGLHLDFNKITLPKGFKKESGQPLHIDHVDLNEAKFKLDVAKLAGGSGGGGTNYTPKDYEFLNQVTGHANMHVIVDLTNVSLYGTLHRDIPFLVNINHGAFNYNQVQSNFPFPISMKLGFDFNDSTGLWSVSLSGHPRFQATVPAPDRKTVQGASTIRLAVLVNGRPVPGPPPEPDDPAMTGLQIANVDVGLRMDAPADIELGPKGENGRINLHSKGKSGELEFTANAPGSIAGTGGLALHLRNLEVGVSELKFGGTKLSAASVAIQEVKDTHLQFSQPTPTDVKAGMLEGTIAVGTADNIDLDFGGGAATPAPTPGPKKGTP